MQPRFLSLLLLLSPLLHSARALDYAWPGHGTISIDVPKKWALIAKQTTDVSYAIKGSHDAAAPDIFQITLIETPADRPILAPDLPTSLQNMTQLMLAKTVEKSISPIALHMKQGSGLMAELTDASLVGKPPTPENYKFARSAVAALDDHALVLVTMLFNDPKDADASEMLGMTQSLRLARGTKTDQLIQTQTNGVFEFTVPESKLRLIIPDNGLVPDTVRVGGATNNPRYFKLSRSSPNLILSGWFEAPQRYKGFKKFWAGEVNSLNKSGFPPLKNVAFVSSGKWEVIAYDVTIPGVTNSQIRAELVQSGTWIDLHLSTTSQQSSEVSREQLLAVLRSIQVTEK